MRKVFLGLLLFFAFAAVAQQKFNNEWIDYQKTYYKFKVGSDGLYRIPAATLAAEGLNAVAAEHFQLWRNGVEVPIYTSKASGPLASSDYIEFWGQMNDGKADKAMYRDPAFHLNDRWSLLTDTAAYFLTVNTAGNNLRLQPTANNVAGNTLPAEPYFMYKAGKYYRDLINRGLFYLVGSDHLFSSSYDKGEGWTSIEIDRGKTLTENFTNLYPAASGPAAKINVALTGNAYNNRRYKITVNGDSVLGNILPYMNEAVEEATFSTSLLNASSTPVVITNNTDACGSSNCPADKMVVHKLEITYPREFNFGNAANFEFALSASATGAYLEITNFNHGGIAPVLYDLTNGKRYEAQLSGSLVKVVLGPSATPRNLVLVSQTATNIASVSTLQTRNFTDYNTASTQGDYLIISNSALFNGPNGTNPVEDYRAYKASTQGGGFNAKIYLEDELCDQFAFGIKKHPLGVRNFILYAQNKYPVPPRFVFLVGRGVNYVHQRTYESSATKSIRDNLENLNLVPTFGSPASDMLLGADLSTSKPLIPIGRLTAITATEVATYLKKVKEYELAQRTPSPLIQDKAWMKNIGHIIGAGDDVLDEVLFQYMENYRNKAEDTLYGAKVTTFRKSSTNAVEQLNSEDLKRLINNGVSILTYYGHSSATTLEFNLDEPANYNNQGKYPMFFALGCNAGNTFDYQESRFTQRNYLSDKYVLAPDRGSINFVASTHFGVVHYLDIWNTRAYTNFSKDLYGRSIGEIMKKTIHDVYGYTTTNDFFARCNAEETVLNGDPSITLKQQVKPDYVITDTLVNVSPSISVAEHSFRVNLKAMNLGQAISKKIVIETKRQFPDGTTLVARRDTIPGIRYMDSLSFLLPIDPLHDKGTNKIFITVDADNNVDELFESNNTTSREFLIFEDEARPVYPVNMGIINQPDVTLKVSTANPFAAARAYRVEIDTTEAFNSPAKVVVNKTAAGGLIEFDPGMTFRDSVVYYWRVSPEPTNGSYTWNTSSFVYLSNHAVGFNQSHFYQHQKSEADELILNQGSVWSYPMIKNNLLIRSGVFVTAVTQAAEFAVAINGDNSLIRSICAWPSLVINVFDPYTFKPWFNASAGQPGQYGSDDICGTDRVYNFQYVLNNADKRKKLIEFLEMIPAGHIVTVRNFGTSDPNNNVFVDVWKQDTAALGSNRSIYHHFLNQGFADIDSFYRPRAFIFTYKKDAKAEVTPKSLFSQGVYDKISLSADYFTPDTIGYATSPVFGPAKSWKEFRWGGKTLDQGAGDNVQFSLIGIQENGDSETIMDGITMSQPVVDLSAINTTRYPFLQMRMRNADSIYHTPYQLGYWRLTYDPLPEGLVAPNLYFQMKDTFDVGEPVDFRMAFKNISASNFTDSIEVKVQVTDRNGVQKPVAVWPLKPLNANDTAILRFNIDTRQLVGSNSLFVDINPESKPLEQYRFNNFAFRNFFVRGDTLNPLMDVTFDNVHILNRDIVSAKPDILIKLKDEAKWMLLNDTSVVTVQVRFPSGALKTYRYNSDTLTFIPATGAPNAANTASIRLRPYFTEDGDYELIVTGKDMSDNAAGAMSYRVGFQVVNKAMISNMLNYPNPFTTSTAFVFTLTGSEVPQNIKIQILTVTGKIVREITKEELGPLRIGRNITEFKWDGTDQFGQKLANGVYLYRVVTNQNGKSLEKFRSTNENTDKYFNKGYGKMYLMR